VQLGALALDHSGKADLIMEISLWPMAVGILCIYSLDSAQGHVHWQTARQFYLFLKVLGFLQLQNTIA
jgi:hypothetical protein